MNRIKNSLVSHNWEASFRSLEFMIRIFTGIGDVGGMRARGCTTTSPMPPRWPKNVEVGRKPNGSNLVVVGKLPIRGGL